METVGPRGQVKGTGYVCLSWDDDEGMTHTHILSNVCYMSGSPFNLFSITEFGKAINPDDHEELIEGTSIQTFLDTQSSSGKRETPKNFFAPAE